LHALEVILLLLKTVLLVSRVLAGLVVIVMIVFCVTRSMPVVA